MNVEDYMTHPLKHDIFCVESLYCLHFRFFAYRKKKKKDEPVHTLSALAYSPILFRPVPIDNKSKKRRAAESVTCILNSLPAIYFMQYM